MHKQTPDRILRMPGLQAKTTLGRSTIYDKLDPASKRHDPTFPRPIPLGPRAKGFSEREVDAWLEARIAVREQLPSKPKHTQSQPEAAKESMT